MIRRLSRANASAELARWLQLNDKGLAAYQSGDWNNAHSLFDLAAQARRSHRDTCFAASLANLARVQVRQERFEQADELLDEALEVLEEQNDGNEQAVALKLSANLERMDLCWALGRVDESLDAARLAIKLLGERRDDRVRWARCRFAVGRALHAKGELEQAELEYRKARELLVQMEKNSFNLAETLRSLAVLCGESGRLKEAQEFYLECLEMLVALKSPQVSMVVVEYSELLKAMGRSEISESIADIVSEGVADQVEAAMSRKEKSH